MEDAEFLKIRRSKLDKFMDVFEGTDKDLKALFVNYDTNVSIDFKNLEREIIQNAGRNFRKNEVKLFSME